MYIKISPKYGRSHLWSFIDFRIATNARQIEYETNGNLIKYVIYEVDKEISTELANEFGFNIEILNNYKPTNSK
jgi:hypothetical protein